MAGQVATALRRLGLLLACALAGDRVLGSVCSAALPHSQLRFSVAMRGGQPPNVLVLGDSRAVNGLYAPELARRAGMPVLNLAYNGMSTLIAEALLSDYLKRNAAPRLLVLEVSNVQWSHQLVDGLMCYWASGPALGALADARSPRNRLAARLFHLYAFNGEVPLRALYYARRSDQDAINHYRISEAVIAAARAAPDFDVGALPENLDALGRITARARSLDIPLRLVVVPYLPDFAAHMRNWDDWLARVRAAAGGEDRIWDYSRAVSDTAHFADRLHLNDLGGAPFAARLAADGFLAVDASPAAQ